MSTPAQPEWNLHRFASRPDERLVGALGQLAAAAAEADGNPPFNDQTWVSLRSSDSAGRVNGVVAVLRAGPSHDDEEVVGAAIITSSPGSAPVLELVVRPEDRGHGIGTDLVSAVLNEAPEDLTAWSHGDSGAAASLAAAQGFSPVRELWRMRSTLKSVPEPTLPDGVSLRPFVPGTDEEAWLRVNAAAFAHHAEQGAMSLQDLIEREREDWFDPAGFLLAVNQDDQILGFHWTKVHAAHTDSRGGEHPAMGEVYVVGISPDAQGMGLGRALTLAGLQHLSRAGLGSVMLYVDADNAPAVKLYRSLGFERWDVDVMYAKNSAPSH